MLLLSSLHCRFCGRTLPPFVLVPTAQLALVFMSDRSVNGAGFSAHWDSVNMTADCDRVYTALSGTIRFNQSDYAATQQCDIHIVLPAMHRMQLNISDLMLPCADGGVTIK